MGKLKNHLNTNIHEYQMQNQYFYYFLCLICSPLSIPVVLLDIGCRKLFHVGDPYEGQPGGNAMALSYYMGLMVWPFVLCIYTYAGMSILFEKVSVIIGRVIDQL